MPLPGTDWRFCFDVLPTIACGSSNPWQKVAFFIDFNKRPPGKDTAKLKSILISLKSAGLEGRG